MMENIVTQIEAAYGFSIKSYAPAPRGFWAETYFINTQKEKYFIKIHRNFPWESTLRLSLELQFQMSEYINNIPKPIKTQSDSLLHTLDDNRIATLYTFIDGGNYYTNDACEVLNLMKDIYKLNVKCDSLYDFKFYAEKIIDEMKTNSYHTKSDILQSFLKKNRIVYIHYWDIYTNLVNKVRNSSKRYYITHGDIAKNLMIDDNNQVFVVDWDRIYLGPIELDLSEFVNKNIDIDILNKTAKEEGLDWEFDKDYHNYFILNKLYYNLRNIVAQDTNNLTGESLIGHQQYIDDICDKFLT